MRRFVTGTMSAVSGLVLLASYHASGHAETATEEPAPAQPTAGNATPAGSAPKTATSPAQAPTGTTGTFTGAPADTRWGVVQVQITVADGRITAAEAIQFPNASRKDQQINARAIPILNAAAVAAQGAGIDAVSGATVTSQGYLSSLQSALDEAHLG